MKIAILQFNPRLGEVEANIKHADALLSASTAQFDLLVLPELAFSGYNFPSLAAISPYLEPTADGPTTHWAIRTARERQCHVIVGYPETTTTTTITTPSPTITDPPGTSGTPGTPGTPPPPPPPTPPHHYNSTITISPQGHILATYRKSFLYYTDETWATEGFRSTASQLPFSTAHLPTLGGQVGHGICMDINPYRFEAPWTAYEFATRMLQQQCRLVVVSMAWLTRLTPEETASRPESPDMETVAYWLERFWPLVESQPREAIVVVLANRCGSEGRGKGGAEMEHGETIELGDRVAYAGSSCVMRFQGGTVKLWERYDGAKKGGVGLLGKGEEGVLVVDTGMQASFLLQQKGASAP